MSRIRDLAVNDGRSPRRPTVVSVGAGAHRQATLEAAGYAVRGLGWHELDRLAPDAALVLLAPGPGEPDAAAVVRSLRDRTEVPVLALLEDSTETERVRTLEAGADDCVDGLGDGELLARVAALLRRTGPPLPDPTGLVVDVESREATVAGTPVVLTRREFDLLARLASAPRRVWTRRQLLEEVWPAGSAERGTATVTEHVRRVRARLVAAGGTGAGLETVRGVGYRLVPERCRVDDAPERRRLRRRAGDPDPGLVVLPELVDPVTEDA